MHFFESVQLEFGSVKKWQLCHQNNDILSPKSLIGFFFSFSAIAKYSLIYSSVLHCKCFDFTQYSFWQCYISHYHLTVHATVQNSKWSQTVLLNDSECQVNFRRLWWLLPNYSDRRNTANNCKLAVNICSVHLRLGELQNMQYCKIELYQKVNYIFVVFPN